MVIRVKSGPPKQPGLQTGKRIERQPPNEREITAARSRGSNLGLSSIRARQPESGALDFQSPSGAAEGDLEAGMGSVKGLEEPER